MNTKTQASWIDHFYIYSSDNDLNIQASDEPEELSKDLVTIVIILKIFEMINQ